MTKKVVQWRGLVNMAMRFPVPVENFIDQLSD
jgi:hypothetical protein